VDLLHAALAGHVELEEDLTVVRTTRRLLILNGIEVPIGKDKMRIARDEEELARAVGVGQVAQKFVGGQRMRRAIFNSGRDRGHGRLRFGHGRRGRGRPHSRRLQAADTQWLTLGLGRFFGGHRRGIRGLCLSMSRANCRTGQKGRETPAEPLTLGCGEKAGKVKSPRSRVDRVTRERRFKIAEG